MYPPYSTDIAAAWEVVEKLRATGEFCCIDVRHPIHEPIECAFYKVASDHKPLIGVGDTAPHAICLAALKAIGVEA